MEQPNNLKITLSKEYLYPVPPEQLWQALTTIEALKLWYFPQIKEFEPIVGHRFEFDDDNAEYQKEWIVTQVVEGKRLAHNWAYKGYPGSSEVIFDIFSEGNNSRLRISQTNIDSFPKLSPFKKERFEWGWNLLLGQNLKQLLETNKPL